MFARWHPSRTLRRPVRSECCLQTTQSECRTQNKPRLRPLGVRKGKAHDRRRSRSPSHSMTVKRPPVHLSLTWSTRNRVDPKMARSKTNREPQTTARSARNNTMRQTPTSQANTDMFPPGFWTLTVPSAAKVVSLSGPHPPYLCPLTRSAVH